MIGCYRRYMLLLISLLGPGCWAWEVRHSTVSPHHACLAPKTVLSAAHSPGSLSPSSLVPQPSLSVLWLSTRWERCTGQVGLLLLSPAGPISPHRAFQPARHAPNAIAAPAHRAGHPFSARVSWPGDAPFSLCLCSTACLPSISQRGLQVMSMDF